MHLSLRTRMVALATVVVAVVLVASGLVLGTALRSVLLDDLRTAAVLRAQDLASLAAQGSLPEPIPIGDADESLVQVVADGRVVASSRNAVGGDPLAVAPPAAGETRVVEVADLPVQDEEDEGGFLVAATTVAAPDGQATVYVATSLEDVGETIAETGRVALIGLPILVLVLAGAMWVIVGRTLAPVEAIRAEAARITGEDLHRRVPEPVQEDEVGRLARTLNAMLRRLEHSAERQRRFVADAAHELRSPIASSRAQLETARSSTRDVDWDRVSAGVLEDTLRVQQLTEQLLLLARADAGTLATHRGTVDLDDAVVRAAADIPEGFDLDLRGVEPVQVAGDPVLLEQVVRNLLDNATRHATGRVAVGLTAGGGEARLTVDDDGPGIPPDDRDAVFERFTRLDDARARADGGAGLGLAIVRDIVTAHGGTVEVTDGPLGGARVTVTVALAP